MKRLVPSAEMTLGPFFPREFPFQQGQPEEIRQAYWAAMGGKMEEPARR